MFDSRKKPTGKKDRQKDFQSWLRSVPTAFLEDVYRHYGDRRDIPLKEFSALQPQPAVKLDATESSPPNTDERRRPIILHKSVFFLIITLLGIEVSFDFIYFALKLPTMYITIPNFYFLSMSIGSIYFALFVFLNICKLLFMLAAALEWVTFTYEITEEEIRYKYGILNRNEKIFLLSYTQEVLYRESMLGKIFHYGTIEMYNPTLKERVYLESIPDPEKHTEIIKNYLPRQSETGYMPLKIHQ